MQQPKTRYIVIGVAVMVLLGFGLFYQHYAKMQESITEQQTVASGTFSTMDTGTGSMDHETDLNAPTASAVLSVHVAGAVEAPGVYQLEDGQRVEDALQLAKPTEDADVDALNRAKRLTDGEKIVVPTLGTPSPTEANTLQPDMATSQELVNLNTADLSTLMQLPGIGAAKGKAILQYREEHNGFQSTEELTKVSGIGTATYEKLQDQITVT